MLEKNRGQDCKKTTTLWLFIIGCAGKNGGQICKKITLWLFTIGRTWEKWRTRLQEEDDLMPLHYTMCLRKIEDKIARKKKTTLQLFIIWHAPKMEDKVARRRPYIGWTASRDRLQEACQSSTCRCRTGVENHCNLHGWYKHIHILSTKCHIHTEDPL